MQDSASEPTLSAAASAATAAAAANSGSENDSDAVANRILDCVKKLLPIGDPVRHTRDGHRGVVHFVGSLPELDARAAGASKKGSATESPTRYVWCGVAWELPHGKNDGCLPSGERIFSCAANHGSFVRLPLTLNGSKAQNFDPAQAEEEIETALQLPRSLAHVLADRYFSHAPVSGFDSSVDAPSGSFFDEELEDAKTARLLLQRQSAGQQQDEVVKRNSKIPSVRDIEGRWPNLLICELGKSVVSRPGKSLGRLFPNLTNVSVADSVISRWEDVLDFPRFCSQSLREFNILESRLLRTAPFPPPAAWEKVSSRSMRLFNATGLHPPPHAFWCFLLAFPNLAELFVADNHWSQIPLPDDELFDAQQKAAVAKTLVTNIEHLVVAHNNFASLDSLIAAFSWARQQLESSPASAESPVIQLSTLNLSHNLQLTRTRGNETASLASASSPLFPKLKTLMLKNTGFETWDSLLELIEPGRRTGNALEELTVQQMALLHPEKVPESRRNAFDVTAMSLFLQHGAMDDGERRRLVIAMAAPTLRKLNGTFIEKTNWFGEDRSRSNRPELRGSRKFAAQLFAGLEKHQLNKKARLVLAEFEEEVRAELAAQEAIAKQGPKMLQTTYQLKVEPVFVSSVEETFKLFVENGFADTLEKFSLFDRHHTSNEGAAAASSSPSSHSQLHAAAPQAHEAMPRAQREQQMRSSTLAADVRWTVQDLELAVAVFLGLCADEVEEGATVSHVQQQMQQQQQPSSQEQEQREQKPRCGGYVPSGVHASAEAWVPLDVSMRRLQLARQQQEQQKEHNGTAATTTTAVGDFSRAPLQLTSKELANAMQQWRHMYPPGSLALFHVDCELLENPGAVKRGMHLKQLLRPAATLHGSRINDGDLIIVVVQQ